MTAESTISSQLNEQGELGKLGESASLGPIHPGEILLEEFLKPLSLSQTRLAIDLGVAPQRIGEIVRGMRGVTTDTALRLARYFGTTPQFWLNLQNRFELDVAIRDRLPEQIEARVRPRAAEVIGADEQVST